jgi:hypothetical protein
MKFALILSFIFTQFLNVTAQDTLISNTGNALSVKIIKVDDNTIYFYQSIDKTKQIRAITKNAIKGYKYNSTENGKNISVIKSDSILYLNYVRKSKDIEPIVVNTETNYDTTLVKNNTETNNINNYSFTVNRYYDKAGSSIIVSGVFLLLGSTLHIYNFNRKIDLTTATIKDINDFYKLSKNLSNISYGLFGASGIFMISAGLNISNGSIKLK